MRDDTFSVRFVKAAALLLIAVLSFTMLYGFFTSDKYKYPVYSYLDGKKTTVVGLAAAATAASAAITLLPGDVGTPIADKLAEISTYTILILCAIFLEKYLVTITGVATFRILIPLACAFLIGNLLIIKKEQCRKLGLKLLSFALLIFLIVPVSVALSRSIEATYESTIQATIEMANADAEEIQESSDQGVLDSLINSIKGGVSAFTKKFETTLTNMIEAVAVLIVTSCLIPLLVLLFFYWLIKVFFNVDIQPPQGLSFFGGNRDQSSTPRA